MGQVNTQLRDALIKLSSTKYGKPRAVVEKEIFTRLGRGAPAAAPSPSAARPSAAKSDIASFLDEWKKKRTQLGGSAAMKEPAAVPPQPKGVILRQPPAARPQPPTAGSTIQQRMQAVLDQPVPPAGQKPPATEPQSPQPATPPVPKNRLDLHGGEDDAGEVSVKLH